MANWTDGPEYAPIERPSAFQSPHAPALEVPIDLPHPADGAPPELPTFQPAATPVPDLAVLVPAREPQRDPHQAFAVTRAALTSQSAWTAAHSTAGTQQVTTWDPRQPLTQTVTTTVNLPAPAPNFPPPAVNQSPFPSAPADWFAPPGWTPPQGPPQVTVGQMWRAATTGVLVPLIVGGLIPSLSMLLLALSFSLTGRVTHRRRQVRFAFGITALVVLALGGLSLFDDSIDLPMFWDVVSGWARWACWCLLIAIPLITGAGLRRGEPAERPN